MVQFLRLVTLDRQLFVVVGLLIGPMGYEPTNIVGTIRLYIVLLNTT